MKNHEANSCQDTSSLSTWKFRAKVNKFAGGRWAGWHPCGGLPFLWATHDWHHHEAFHWSEGILAKLTKLSRGRYDIPSWPKLEDELRWKRLQLHELTWSSCCLDFLDKFAAKWQLNTVKKQRSPGLTAVHQKMLKKSESKQAPSEPRHPRSSERFLFCCRRCRGEGCGTGLHISHHSWPIGFLFAKVLLGDAFVLPGFVMDGVLNVWRKCTFVR